MNHFYPCRGSIVCYTDSIFYIVATQYKFSVSEVDSMANRENEGWHPDQEEELLRLVHDDAYRIDKIGDFTTNWPPIAHYLGRTVKSVKRKYDKLYKHRQHEHHHQDHHHQEQRHQQHATGHFVGQGTYAHGTKQYYPVEMLRMGDGSQPYGGDMPPDDMGALLSQGYPPQYAPHMYPAGVQEAMYQPQYDSMTYRAHIKPPPPKNDKSFWKDSELAELLRLCREEDYRQHVTGSKDLDWQIIANIFGRGKRSVQRKFENLKSATFAADGTLILPRNLGKKWTKAEVDELMQIADPEDSSLRYKLFGSHKINWRTFGEYFGRSHEAVAYKYSYEKNSDERIQGSSGHKKHAKAKHETSYKDMAIKALQYLGGEGTSGQMCDFISQDELFAPQLDQSIVSGKKTLQRWKHGVRSALNAFEIFEKTEQTFKGESVWILNLPEDYRGDGRKTRRKKKSESRTRKRQKSTAGNESGEEFAREVLTQMAQNKTKNKKRRTKGNSTAEKATKNESIPPMIYQGAANDLLQLPANLQQILDSSATAEQLSLLPPEHLAMLQQQIDQGNFAMNMMAYMPALPEGHQTVMVDPGSQAFHDQQGYPGYDSQFDPQQRGVIGPNEVQQGPLIQGVHMGQHALHPGGMLQMHPGPDYQVYNPYGGFMPYQYPDPSQQHYQPEQYTQGSMGTYMPMHPGGQPHVDRQQYQEEAQHDT